MKIVGRIFLLISGILFLVWGVSDCISAIQYILSGVPEGLTLAAWALQIGIKFLNCALYVFGGIGGIFWFIGIGPFRGWVPVLAILILVFLIVDIVTTLMNGGSFGWLLGASTATSVIYFLGWCFARRRN